MDFESKLNRHFKLKSSRRNQNESHTWFNNSDDQNIRKDDNKCETNRQKNVRTPVRPLRTSNVSPVPQNSSPQFRVGWNDGSQKNICDMSSPVSAVPARRKIRRCPENLISKISPFAVESKKKDNDERNNCDILQCINWAKSLMESSSLPSSYDKEVPVPDKNITEITESIKDTSLDIALDDSSNELMILCSQAVEESVSAGTLTLENKKPHSEKHQITPNCDRSANKRFKPQFNANNSLPEGNASNFDRRLDRCDQKVNNTPVSNNFTKALFKAESNFKKPIETCANNNNANLKSFNPNSTDFKFPNNLCKVPKENETISSRTTSSTSSDKSSPGLSNDDIKSHLDDEDDVFCSLDFNFLDSLHKTTTEPSKPVLKPTPAMVKPQEKNCESSKFDTKPLVTKYTKQEIEKRRLEAKKRLLFNKKHRSM